MTYRHFSIEEREIIAIRLAEEASLTDIGKELRRHHSSVIAEIRRNSVRGIYYPARAQAKADSRRSESKSPWRMEDSKIAEYVKGSLKHRWSPEQISGRMKKEHPDDKSMRVSHQTIYRWIEDDQQRGGQWRAFLRQSGKKRRKRYGTSEKRGQLKNRVDIDKRPVEADLKQRIGDWEGDTVEGAKGSGYLATMVDRKTQYLVVGHSKTKHANVVRRAIERSFRRHGNLPCETITLDNGKEFAEHEKLGASLDADVYFAKPYHPWERGLNENTNGLLRQYFPKGMDFSKITTRQLKQVETELNNRPRKTLNYRTPSEVMQE